MLSPPGLNQDTQAEIRMTVRLAIAFKDDLHHEAADQLTLAIPSCTIHSYYGILQSSRDKVVFRLSG